MFIVANWVFYYFALVSLFRIENPNIYILKFFVYLYFGNVTLADLEDIFSRLLFK